MLLPAATGSGASVLVRVNRVVDSTVVVAAAPLTGAVSLQSMLSVRWVSPGRVATGVLIDTTSGTEPEAPEVRVRRFKVTTPAASAPPPVAPTKVVPAGRASEITTPVASAL